jgi:hypothetical protein
MDQRVAKRMKQLACSRRNAEVLEVVVGGIELKRKKCGTGLRYAAIMDASCPLGL